MRQSGAVWITFSLRPNCGMECFEGGRSLIVETDQNSECRKQSKVEPARPRCIVVLGAGLVGCYVGARLSTVVPVTLIGRPELLEELKHNQLRFSDQNGAEDVAPSGGWTATDRATALAQAGLILLTVKSGATADAAREIAKNAPLAAPIVSLQNGVGNVEALRSFLPGRTVLGGMVPFNVTRRAPGHFHQGTSGYVVVGDDAALAPWLDLFGRAGLPLRRSRDMESIAWGKLIVNLNNAVNALAGLSLAEQLADRNYRRVWSMAIGEALALLRAAGIKPARFNGRSLRVIAIILALPNALYRRLSNGAGGVDRHARSSMADDLAAGKRTEVDAINGAVVALASRLGLRAAVNARLVELVHAAERGSVAWTSAALRRDIASRKSSGIATA